MTDPLRPSPVDPASLRLLVLDVDGVLTDGSVLLDDEGCEIKRFNIRDGLGIRLWQWSGRSVAIITGRAGKALLRRARELDIDLVIQGSSDKAAAIDDLSATTGIAPAAMAYLGDDLPDIPAMVRVGCPAAVADADPLVIDHAAIVTTRPGGRGAVRELIETLLESAGELDGLVSRFLPRDAEPQETPADRIP